MSTYRVVDPRTEQLHEEFPSLTPPQAEALVGRAHTAFASWRARPVHERAAILLSVAQRVRERSPELAEHASLEMGKPVSAALGELGLVADIFEYYATAGPALLQGQDFTPLSGRTWGRRATHPNG